MKTIPKELGLLVGIVAAFVFLLSFFVGAGVSVQTVSGVGLFFLVVTLALIPLFTSKASG